MSWLKNEMPIKIPKIIWQTYKHFPPQNSKTNIESWINLNPDYIWMYMDDFRCSKFINENFSSQFSSMYNSLPLGVMKADVWRVAVVYVYGGIYTDLDCKCLKPISSWLNYEDELVVGVEMDNGDLLNYIFAARPKHLALLNVLNCFMELYHSSNFLDKNTKTPVQNFGQYGFSNGILRHFGVNTEELKRKGGTSNYYNELSKVKEEKTKFILKQNNIFSHESSENTAVLHEIASLKWKNYNSWRKEQELYMKNK